MSAWERGRDRVQSQKVRLHPPGYKVHLRVKHTCAQVCLCAGDKRDMYMSVEVREEGRQAAMCCLLGGACRVMGVYHVCGYTLQRTCLLNPQLYRSSLGHL